MHNERSRCGYSRRIEAAAATNGSSRKHSFAALETNIVAQADPAQRPSKKQKKAHAVIGNEEEEAEVKVSADADAEKPKKSKKKAKAAKLELTAEVPASGAANPSVPNPDKPAQAVAVAMPAEAVEELADAIADANGGPIQLVANDSNTDGRRTSGGGRAFQRVKAEEWIGQKGAIDNSYQATFGEDGWGAKAQQVLGQVRGKDFRHEKTKKKRGTYKGGQIDFKVNSFKYDSD
ncbi:hypothetical protein WJX84_005211 [Apatococcus fuscideae]|uniref:Srp40 C-terminal domain-containing protein n=1 Tax=Apatococcus fuscideae TaxID=2026836 RepID=A0AAW1TKM8_9CHLO